MKFSFFPSPKSISWKYKLALFAILPILITIASSAIFSFNMMQQSKTVRVTIESLNERRQYSNEALIEILQFQTAIQQLIASDNKSQIRENAIAVIRASSIVDEICSVYRKHCLTIKM
jgi:ABC-type multidrug transport system fused ATPase/permease subunit